LFAGIQGVPANHMFNTTFAYCTGLTSIPENLFAGISGAPAIGMFYYTFQNCRRLTSIPAELFGNLLDADSGEYIPEQGMFNGTFYECSGLTGPSATLGGQYLYNLFPAATTNHVDECYRGATGLDDYDSMPSDWK
jgi:hypothetical protein